MRITFNELTNTLQYDAILYFTLDTSIVQNMMDMYRDSHMSPLLWVSTIRLVMSKTCNEFKYIVEPSYLLTYLENRIHK